MELNPIGTVLRLGLKVENVGQNLSQIRNPHPMGNQSRQRVKVNNMNRTIIDKAYAHCEQICRNASTTFYASFSALEYDKRRAVHAVYALCRWVDDIVDGDEETIMLADAELMKQTQERDTLVREIHAGKSPADSEEVYFSRLMSLVSIRNHLASASKQKITADNHPVFILSLIHISSPRDQRGSRMPSSA